MHAPVRHLQRVTQRHERQTDRSRRRALARGGPRIDDASVSRLPSGWVVRIATRRA